MEDPIYFLEVQKLNKQSLRGTPEGNECNGTQWACSMAKREDRVSDGIVVLSQFSIKSSGSLPSDASGKPTKRDLLHCSLSSKSVSLVA